MMNSLSKSLLKSIIRLIPALCLAASPWVSGMSSVDYSEITNLPLISDHCGNQSCRHLTNLNPNPLPPITVGENETLPNPGGTGLIYQSQRHPFGASQLPQKVFLDFTQTAATFRAVTLSGEIEIFQSHTFSMMEKDSIQSRLEADFSEFNLNFTQILPTDSDYATLKFECNPTDGICVNLENGVLLGHANEPDSGNWSRTDIAYADPNLWQAVMQIDPSGELLSNLTGIDIVDGDTDAALSNAIINQSANVGAHQLGHNLGLRHQDAFGAPGSGIINNEHNLALSYFPHFTGPQSADETLSHLMSSASMGANLRQIANSDLFFSERSALRLHALDEGYYQTEREAIGEQPGEQSNIQTIHLRKVKVPNTLVSGANAHNELNVRATIVSATIDGDDDIDYYRFYATAGHYLSADINSFDVPTSDRFVTNLSLYYQNSDGTYQLINENQQTFEGYDGAILDAFLAEEGNYVVTVSSAVNINQGDDESGNPEWLNLYDSWNGHLRGGDYKLFVYMFLP